MPKFHIYSRLDKNLLKMLLIRATEVADTDDQALEFNQLEELRRKYFGPLCAYRDFKGDYTPTVKFEPARESPRRIE